MQTRLMWCVIQIKTLLNDSTRHTPLILFCRRCKRTWKNARTSWRRWSNWRPIIPRLLRRPRTWRRWCRTCWYVRSLLICDRRVWIPHVKQNSFIKRHEEKTLEISCCGIQVPHKHHANSKYSTTLILKDVFVRNSFSRIRVPYKSLKAHCIS